MYEDMYGQNEYAGGLFPKRFAPENLTWMCVFHFLMTVVILVILVVQMMKPEAFANLPDYGIGQRGDVIAAVPAYEEQSLRQRIDQAVSAGNVSQLTGTRDVPVFFQDQNVEMQRKQEGTAVFNTREGFEGGKQDNDLQRALAGH